MRNQLLPGERDVDLLPFDEEGSREANRPSVLDWGHLLLHATWRRKRVAAGVFLLSLCAVAVYYVSAPRLYRSEATILAQRQQALPSVVRQGAPDEAPTRSADEMIHSRDNLRALLRSAGLVVDGTSPPRTLLDRLMDSLALVAGAPEQDPSGPLVRRLDNSLGVTTSDGTIRISLDWPDAQQAYLIVGAAAQNFLELRYLQDVTTIDESITLLRGRLGPLREQLDDAIVDAQRSGVFVTEAPASPSAPPVATPVQRSEATTGLQASMEAKARAIRDIEDFRRRRLLDLQAQLEERRGQYAEAHPAIVGLRREISGLSQESRQVETLREEERTLREEYSARTAASRTSSQRPTPRGPRVTSSAAVDQSERVRDARFQYQQMMTRVSAAQTDLDNARAAFKHRYKVSWPATVPSEPVSPRPVKIFSLGVMLASFLAVLAAAAPDLWHRRVVERWQIERGLGIPVLSSLHRR